MKTRVINIKEGEILEIRHAPTNTVLKVALDFERETVQVAHRSSDTGLGFTYFGERFFEKIEKAKVQE